MNLVTPVNDNCIMPVGTCDDSRDIKLSTTHLVKLKLILIKEKAL